MQRGSSDWKHWVYTETARRWGLSPHAFGFDDPQLIEEHLLDNTCRIDAQPGNLVMDIGANRGVVTLMCAIRGAKVVAYEPSPAAFPILQELVGRNHLEDRVQTINAAVTNSNGRTKLLYNEIPPDKRQEKVVNGNILGPFNPSGIDHVCEVDTIAFADAIGDRIWDIVKIDVEGFEYRLLLDCPESIFAQIKYLTLELHHDVTPREVHDDLVNRLRKFFTLDGGQNESGRYYSIFAKATSEVFHGRYVANQGRAWGVQ